MRTSIAAVLAAASGLVLAGPAPAAVSAPLTTCHGEPVSPLIHPTDGDDVLQGTSLRDVVNLGGGDDVFNGLGGDDLVCGGPGGDLVFGSDGNDVLDGGDGRDKLIGNAGHDKLLGRGGADGFQVRSPHAGGRVVGGGGADSVSFRQLGRAVHVDLADRRASWRSGSVVVRSVVVARGSGRADTLVGTSGPDFLDGGGGDDVLKGKGGNDLLRGRHGHDRAVGGHGGDVCLAEVETGCEV